MVTKIDIDNVYILQNKREKTKQISIVSWKIYCLTSKNIDSQTHIKVSKE